MNAAYVLGARLTNAFAQYGFCTAIRGAEGGGKVENLPYHVFTSDDGDQDAKCPTEIAITDRREFELSNLGFQPLSHYKNTDYSVFFGAQSVQKPKKYDRPEATANAAISARMPYIMASSRFAHYLKVMARDKIGSFMEAGDVERWLNRWINNYVNGNENAGQEMKARFPLREARVEVREIPGKPGSVQCGGVSTPVAADGRADHEPAHGGTHPGPGGLIAAQHGIKQVMPGHGSRFVVMAGLGPAIHVFAAYMRQRRGWPVCAGHDEVALAPRRCIDAGRTRQ